MSVAERPPPTVIMPLPTSISPPAFAAKPPTVVCRKGVTARVPPASGTTVLAASADGCASRSVPCWIVVEPVRVLA